jgi:hypothetical protein
MPLGWKTFNKFSNFNAVPTIYLIVFHSLTTNVLRAGDRNPVLRLRQGYGACTLLWAGFLSIFFFYTI